MQLLVVLAWDHSIDLKTMILLNKLAYADTYEYSKLKINVSNNKFLRCLDRGTIHSKSMREHNW